MASSTTGSFYTSFANIRMPEGHYLILEFDYDYDDDGNPFVIEVRDGTGTEIENPDPNIIKEIIKEIPEFTGQPRAGLWFKNGVNSLSPRQSPGQTNNIFLGFETAENFDLNDLATYSGDYNTFIGYQIGGSLTTGRNNFIAGNQLGQNLTTGNYNVVLGVNNLSSLSTGNSNFSFGSNNAPLNSNSTGSFIGGNGNLSLASTNILYSFTNGGQLLINASDIRYSFVNGFNSAKGATGNFWYNFVNGNEIGNGGGMQYTFANGYQNMKNSSTNTFSFANGWLNFNGTGSNYASFASGRANFHANTSNVDYSFAAGRENFYNNSSVLYSTAIGYRNIYQSTSSISNVIAIGRENGYNPVDQSNSIYLGYRQGYTTGGTNKLMIGMAQDDPLLSGDFSADWIRVDGYLEVRDKTGLTTGNVVVWDGDKLVDSGSAIGSLGGDPDQTLTWTNTSTTVRDLTISGTGNTVELDGLAVEMALDDIVLNTSWRYQALDVNGVVLGAPLIIQEGTDINIVRSGNTLIFNSTAGGGDPDQTISYTESTKTLLLSGSFSSVQLDGLVDNTSWTGTSGTITYSLLDVDDILVGAPLIFNAGTDMGIVRSGNTLTFSYTGSGASLWTDAGTYYRPNNLSNLASNSFRIYGTGRVTIGGTSDPTPYLLSVNGIGRFTSGVSLNGNLEFTNSSNIVFDSGGSGNIVDTNGVSGSSGKFLGHDGGGVAWVDAPGYTPTYATSTGNADTFTTGTYVNINGASTTYTIPVTEVLAVWCSVIILGGSSGANVTVSIRKNSSIILISRTIFVEAGVEKNISLHSNDDFNSGDTLRIHCSTSGSGFETVSTNTTWITVT